MRQVIFILALVVTGLTIAANKRVNDVGGWEKVFEEADQLYNANLLDEVNCESGANAAVGVVLTNMLGREDTVLSVSELETISHSNSDTPYYSCRVTALTTFGVRTVFFETVNFSGEIYWSYSTAPTLHSNNNFDY